MCRRCGESDKRGNAAGRRRSRAALLAHHGNGTICPCLWCGELVADAPGYLRVAGRRLPIQRMERDRLIPGGPYAAWNLVPSCGPCNRSRNADTPEGCEYG